jgi:hypothetical protein
MKVLESYPYPGGCRTISQHHDGTLSVVTEPRRKMAYVVRDVETVEEGRQLIQELEAGR